MNKLFITFLKKSQSRVKICIGLCLSLIFSICSGSTITRADLPVLDTTWSISYDWYKVDFSQVSNTYTFSSEYTTSGESDFPTYFKTDVIFNIIYNLLVYSDREDYYNVNSNCVLQYNNKAKLSESLDNFFDHFPDASASVMVTTYTSGDQALTMHDCGRITIFLQPLSLSNDDFSNGIQNNFNGVYTPGSISPLLNTSSYRLSIWDSYSFWGASSQSSSGSFFALPWNTAGGLPAYNTQYGTYSINNRSTGNKSLDYWWGTAYNDFGSVFGNYDKDLYVFDFYVSDSNTANILTASESTICYNCYPDYDLSDSHIRSVMFGSLGNFYKLNSTSGITVSLNDNQYFYTVTPNLTVDVASFPATSPTSSIITPSPSPSVSPNPSGSPEVTPQPQYTQIPYYTQAPYYTQMPYPTQQPYNTQAPYYTQIPYPTQRPYYTQIPYPSGLNDLGELTDKLLTPMPNPTGSDLQYYDFDLDSVNINLNNDLTNSQSKNFFFAFISILWDKMNLLCFGYFALALGLIFIWYLLGHGRRG